MNPALVSHDLESNVYHRINKFTGQSVKSHKNGEPIKKFDVDVTGKDYRRRKIQSFEKKQQITYVPLGRSNSKTLRRKRLDQRQGYLNDIIDRVASNQEILRKQSRDKWNSRLAESRSKTQQDSQNNLLSHFFTIQQRQDTPQPLMPISQLLSNYSQINDSKVFQNHSHFKKESGVKQNNKKFINSKGFRETRNSLHKISSLKPERNIISLSKMSIYQPQQKAKWSNQIAKQKKLFLQFHPEYEIKINQKQLQNQMERRKNMKKLEKLFLDQTNKITSSLYQN